jgi:hypothetical protein
MSQIKPRRRRKAFIGIVSALLTSMLAPRAISAQGCSYYVHLLLDRSGSVMAGDSMSPYRVTIRALERILISEKLAFMNSRFKLVVTPFGARPQPESASEASGRTEIQRLLFALLDKPPDVDRARTDLVEVMKLVGKEGQVPQEHKVVIIASDFAHDVGKSPEDDAEDWRARMEQIDEETRRSLAEAFKGRQHFAFILLVSPAAAKDQERQRAVLQWFADAGLGDRLDIVASRQQFEATLSRRLFPLYIRPWYKGKSADGLNFDLQIDNYGCAKCTISRINLFPILAGPKPVEVGSGTEDPQIVPLELAPGESGRRPRTIKCQPSTDRFRVAVLGEWGGSTGGNASDRLNQLNRMDTDYLSCNNIIEVERTSIGRSGAELSLKLRLRGQIVHDRPYRLVVVNGYGQDVASSARFRISNDEINSQNDDEVSIRAHLTEGIWATLGLLSSPLSVRLYGEGAEPEETPVISPLKRPWLLMPLSPATLRCLVAPFLLWGVAFVVLSFLYRVAPSISNLASMVTIVWASWIFSVLNLAAEPAGDTPLWVSAVQPFLSSRGSVVIGLLLSAGFGIPLLWEGRDRALLSVPLGESARELALRFSRGTGRRWRPRPLKMLSFGLRVLSLAAVGYLLYDALKAIGRTP